MKKPITYKDSGVDISAGDDFVENIKKINPGIGGFGGLVSIPAGFSDPLLVLGTDGVGTKLLIAEELEVYDTIGIDLVAMVVNDIVVSGATPFAFLDYYATAKLQQAQAQAILSGIVEGCRQAGCELTGGETAELPGVYPPGGFDLAGFGVGVVERSQVIDGSRLAPGDRLIGLPSSGIHSNGFSLARRVADSISLSEGERRKVLKRMLEPTRIYVKPLLELISEFPVKALAHITGGGIGGNLIRVLPEGVSAVIDRQCWTSPEIFGWLADNGPVAEEEMHRVFNMGVGMIAAIDAPRAERAIECLRANGCDAMEIGRIEAGARGVQLV